MAQVVERPGFAVNAVADAAAVLVAAPLQELSSAEVAAGLVAVQRASRLLDAVRVGLVGEAASRGLATTAGATSTAAWLRGLLGDTVRAARNDVTLAEAFTGEAAETGAALAAAAIGIEHAAAIVRTLDRLPARVDSAERAAAQTQLLAWAQEYDATSVTRLGRHLGHVMDPDSGGDLAAAELRAVEAREITVGTDGDGMVHGAFRLDPVAGAALLAALHPLSAPHPAADGVPDPRTARRRRADALIRLVELAMHNGDLPRTGGLPVTMTVTMTLETLARRLADAGLAAPGTAAGLGPVGVLPGVLDNGHAVSAETLRLLACDARVIPVVLGAHSEPLDVGRATRTVPAGLRRALITRDQGCAFPGCDRPPSWCDAHHTKHWADGGETCLTNLVLLCAHHHRVVHHDGWRITHGPGGHPDFHPPPWITQRGPTRRHRWRDDLDAFTRKRC